MEKSLHGCRFRNSSLKNHFGFKLRYDIDKDHKTFLQEQKDQSNVQNQRLNLKILVYCIQLD